MELGHFPNAAQAARQPVRERAIRVADREKGGWAPNASICLGGRIIACMSFAARA